MVFGPQKGADEGQTRGWRWGWRGWRGCLAVTLPPRGLGLGGTGYGLAAAWGAVLTPGAVELGRLAGLDRALADADLVITGEGRFDETSLTGKTSGP